MLNPQKVEAVVKFVKKHPGCTKVQASAAVASQASYGYRFVQGAIEQGLIKAERQTNKVGRPYVLNVA